MFCNQKGVSNDDDANPKTNPAKKRNKKMKFTKEKNIISNVNNAERLFKSNNLEFISRLAIKMYKKRFNGNLFFVPARSCS